MKTMEEAAREYVSEIKKEYPNEILSKPSIIEDFKAGVEFAQRWIPVREELPRDGTEIIAKNSSYRECFYFYRDGYKDQEYLLHFTHWRLLEIE